MQKVVPEILSSTPEMQSRGDLLADYLQLNGELRILLQLRMQTAQTHAIRGKEGSVPVKPESVQARHVLVKVDAKSDDKEKEAASHYMDSIHGNNLLKDGKVVSASCTDCHGVHDIKRAIDSSSPVNRANLADTELAAAAADVPSRTRIETFRNAQAVWDSWVTIAVLLSLVTIVIESGYRVNLPGIWSWVIRVLDYLIMGLFAVDVFLGYLFAPSRWQHFRRR